MTGPLTWIVKKSAKEISVLFLVKRNETCYVHLSLNLSRPFTYNLVQFKLFCCTSG